MWSRAMKLIHKTPWKKIPIQMPLYLNVWDYPDLKIRKVNVYHGIFQWDEQVRGSSNLN
jgi:hypothetical protein